jgi:hypothetical protein
MLVTSLVSFCSNNSSHSITHAIHQVRADQLTCVLPFPRDNFFPFFNTARVVGFNAAFQICPQVLYRVEVRRVGWELDQTHSIVVKPFQRAIRLVIGGVVLEVEPRTVRPEAKSAGLHPPLHSVTIQPSVHAVVKDSQCAHSLTAETRPDADFRGKVTGMDKSKCLSRNENEQLHYLEYHVSIECHVPY